MKDVEIEYLRLIRKLFVNMISLRGKIMSKGVNVLDGTVLQEFLGADGVTELRKKVIDMIVEEIRDQLIDSSCYIISPDDVAKEVYESVIEEVIEEIKKEYKTKIAEVVQKKMEMIGL